MAVGLESYALVYRYFGTPISESMDMDVLTFAKLYRDATVLKLRESKEGQEYLEKCWRLKQTAPDVAALREQFT